LQLSYSSVALKLHALYGYDSAAVNVIYWRWPKDQLHIYTTVFIIGYIVSGTAHVKPDTENVFKYYSRAHHIFSFYK
jgi:uncharacterized membrane protein YsdA (DUF1294 family)